MKLSYNAYELVKAGREDLAEALREIEAGERPDVEASEVVMLQEKLRGLDALIIKHRRRAFH